MQMRSSQGCDEREKDVPIDSLQGYGQSSLPMSALSSSLQTSLLAPASMLKRRVDHSNLDEALAHRICFFDQLFQPPGSITGRELIMSCSTGHCRHQAWPGAGF